MTARNAALTALALPLVPVALMAALAVGVLAVVHSLTFGAGRRLGLADRSESTLPLWLALACVEPAAETVAHVETAPAVEQPQEASQAAQLVEAMVEPVATPEPVVVSLPEPAVEPLAETVEVDRQTFDGAEVRASVDLLEAAGLIQAAREELAAEAAGLVSKTARQPRKGKAVAQQAARLTAAVEPVAETTSDPAGLHTATTLPSGRRKYQPVAFVEPVAGTYYRKAGSRWKLVEYRPARKATKARRAAV